MFKKLKTKYNEQEQHFDETIYNHSLWKRFEGKELNSEQVVFLSQCMTENLNHLRHAENERLTFNSIFLALAAGIFAFADSLDPKIAFFVFLATTIAGFLSITLTARWNNTFARHMFYAQQCYMLIHKTLFNDNAPPATEDFFLETVESIKGLDDVPMYSFRIRKPIAYTFFGNFMFRFRTKTLYILFYWIIQILLIGATLSSLIKGYF